MEVTQTADKIVFTRKKASQRLTSSCSVRLTPEAYSALDTLSQRTSVSITKLSSELIMWAIAHCEIEDDQ